MKLKKTLAVAAAAGALAAISVPAMAFENEFHGMYNLVFAVSNVDNATAGAIDPTTYRDDNKVNNFFQQRARLQYTAKASDDLKLVTHFELDSKFGGQGGNGYKSAGNDAGQMDADSLTLETKNIYLDFNLGKNVNVKTGIQGVSDKFKGILLSGADLAGITTTAKLNALTLTAGYYRAFNDVLAVSTTNNGITGQNNFDIGILDAQYNIGKNAAVGMEYILFGDSRSSSNVRSVNTIGVYGTAKVGPATISGFGAYQAGQTQANPAIHLAPNNTNFKSGVAANFGVRVPVGPGTLKTAYLFTSGDDNLDGRDTAWFAPRVSNAAAVSSYNESGMMLLNRNTANSIGSNDREIIQHMGGDKTNGFSIASLGYDANITPKLFVNTNIGMAWATKSQSNVNGGDHMGTELNIETGYKVYDSLTAKFQAAYVMLGGFYNGKATNSAGIYELKNPENPYTARLILQYAF